MKVHSLAVVLAPLVAVGCGSTLGQLPSDEDFAKPVGEILSQYPILEEYQSGERIWATTIFNMPPSEELVAAWGEPDNTRLSWWMLIPSNWIFHPSTAWEWNKGDKLVSATITYSLGLGYTGHVFAVDVEVAEDEDIDEDIDEDASSDGEQ